MRRIHCDPNADEHTGQYAYSYTDLDGYIYINANEDACTSYANGHSANSDSCTCPANRHVYSAYSHAC